MTNVNELKEALKETLQERGELNKIKAMMRAAIFDAIETDDKPKPKLSDENLIINELIKDYLKYNNYLHTSSVFVAESGQPVDSPIDRNFIAKELNIVEEQSSAKVPLLYSILFGLKKEVYDPNANFNNDYQVINHNSTKFKEKSINMNSTKNKDKNFMEGRSDQPKPWIID